MRPNRSVRVPRDVIDETIRCCEQQVVRYDQASGTGETALVDQWWTPRPQQGAVGFATRLDPVERRVGHVDDAVRNHRVV